VVDFNEEVAMTIRPFHLIRPRRAGIRADFGWHAAVVFSIVAIAGAVPGFLSMCWFAAIGLGSLFEFSAPGAIGGFAMAAYIGWGFAQAAFYIRRLGGRTRAEVLWWLSTVFYNIPVAVVCIGWAFSEPSPWSVTAALATLGGIGLAGIAADCARTS
jgi:hypothetical protein